jgi:4-hydroxy 2-oxovalerate aldolase
MVEYHDLTIRDGCHAISHKLTADMIKKHCIFAEKAGIPVMEIGHGNGIGASSILIGEAELTDIEMISLAKNYLKNTKLSVHVIPGLATIERDIDPAINLGVDIFRIASHCTEATMTKSHIEYLVSRNKIVYGALMMCATCPLDVLVGEVEKMKSYGASAVIIMDSTGSFFPEDVEKTFTELSKIGIHLGFHGHRRFT